MKIEKYPDGTSYAIVDGNETDFTYRINTYEDLWHLHQIVDALNNMGITPNVFIPNLLDAQADRRFANNQSSGLKLVCGHLNQMDANFTVFHPHNPEVVEAFMPGVKIIDNSGFIEQVLYSLHLSKVDNPILMSSDAGGFKPLMKLCDKIGWKGETFSASKSRSWDEVDGTKFVQQINRDDFGGKDILIIDDLCVFGGTFIGLSNLLKDKNYGKLYLAVSHMTIERFRDNTLFKLYDKVFTTNSKFDSYYVTIKDNAIRPSNLEVINIF